VFGRLKKRFASSAPQGPSSEDSPLEPSLNDAYRLHRQEDVARFTQLAIDAFPKYAERVTCFGADWIGRQFATDKARVVDGEAQVLLFEPGSGEVFEIPASFETFHSEELLLHPNEAVELELFQKWVGSGGAQPNYDQCIGYKKPLYLGGTHDFANFELSDFEVYWSICGQIMDQIRGLPPGTKIGSISIGDA
jgi:hypothetical protein